MKKSNLFCLMLVIIVAVWTTVISFQRIALKPCSHDEALGLLWGSGHSKSEIINHFSWENPFTVAELRKYEQLDFNSVSLWTIFLKLKEITVIAAKEEPTHPPFYYYLVFSQELFSKQALIACRMISAVARVISPWLLGWFAFELFGSTLVGVITISLIYVSPFHMRIGMLARDYSILIGFFSLMSVAFLGWVRTNKKKYFICYALLNCLSFYLSFLSVMVLLAHGIFLAVRSNSNRLELLKGYGKSVSLAVVTFLPWAFFCMHYSQVRENPLLPENKTVDYLLKSIGKNVVQVVFDLNDVDRLLKWYGIPIIISIFIVLVLATYKILRENQSNSKLLIWIGLSNFVPFLFLDLIYTSTYYTADRHLILFQSAVSLILARGIQIGIESPRIVSRLFSWFAYLGIVLIGLFSCEIVTSALNWQSGSTGYFNKDIVGDLNFQTRPLVLSRVGGTHFGNLLAMSNDLQSDTRMVLSEDLRLLNWRKLLSRENLPVFVFDPTPDDFRFFEAEKLELSTVRRGMPLFQIGSKSELLGGVEK